jgi:hypothetical protein
LGISREIKHFLTRKINIMEAIHYPANASRAKALFRKVRTEIPAMIKGLAEYCKYIIDNESEHRSKWPQNYFISFDFWLSLANEADQAIKDNAAKIDNNINVFSFQLFESRCVCLVVDFITRFGSMVSKKFENAVKEIF